MFEDYLPENKTFLETIEELAVACMNNHMQPPTMMVFDEESFDKLVLSLTLKGMKLENLNPDCVEINTLAGPIKILKGSFKKQVVVV